MVDVHDEGRESGVWDEVARPIRGGEAAPHSSLAHFRCVAEHEVRLLAGSPEEFFDALNQSISRYIGSTSQAGEIREYRDASGRLIAYAHEVTKGRVIRGQWFYATDEAARRIRTRICFLKTRLAARTRSETC